MVARFWDFARTRPETFFSYQVGAVVARKFRKHFSGRDIIDYGAGNGFLVEDLLEIGMRCGAVEFGSRAVEELNDRFERHPRFLGVRPHDGLDDFRGKFSGAFLVEVVEHLYDSELATALSTARELLKPGGILIVTTPNEEDRSMSFICSPESGLLFHKFQHVRSWSAASLRATLENHGFSCAEVAATDFGASPLAMRRNTSLPRRIATAAAKFLLRRQPHLYAVARKSPE